MSAIKKIIKWFYGKKSSKVFDLSMDEEAYHELISQASRGDF